jgi:hypothetical protein
MSGISMVEAGLSILSDLVLKVTPIRLMTNEGYTFLTLVSSLLGTSNCNLRQDFSTYPRD